MPRPANVNPISGEEWRPLAACGLYQVSNMGRIKSSRMSAQYGNNDRLLVGSLDKDGYRRVTLPVEGKRIYLHVARMVAETWIGARPMGMVLCHKDGNNQNDIADNLEYKTQLKNIHDKFKHGTIANGEKNGNSKLREDQVLEILSLPDHPIKIARRFGVNRTTIDAIKKKKTWKHLSL